MKKKIAFVVQRYGKEVNGGAEYHCRLLAERMCRYYEVDVLTTKALDYMTWENHYRADVEVVNEVTVRRFDVVSPRNVAEFNTFSSKLFKDLKNNTYFDELEWLRLQGPQSDSLITYIKNYHAQYHAVIFFTYLYYPTYVGLQIIPEKSILIPTAHDEPPIYLSLFKSLFHVPRKILYNTLGERKLVTKLFHNEHVPSDVVGIGVNMPSLVPSPAKFRDQMNIRGSYILYIGRIDESKGCNEMFEHYLTLCKENEDIPLLVLLGKPVMPIPEHKKIIPLGFVSEEMKYSAIQGAVCVVMPSKYESLSMVVLESMLMQTPVVVNGQCEVLREHCEQGNAGLYYTNFLEFRETVNLLIHNQELRQALGVNGKKYVQNQYDWEIIDRKVTESIEEIASCGKA